MNEYVQKTSNQKFNFELIELIICPLDCLQKSKL